MGKLTATKEKLEQNKNPRNQAEEALLGLLLNYEVKIQPVTEFRKAGGANQCLTLKLGGG